MRILAFTAPILAFAMGCDQVNELDDCSGEGVDATLAITDVGFDPDNLTIDEEDVVRFVNNTDEVVAVEGFNDDDNDLFEDPEFDFEIRPDQEFCAEFNRGSESYTLRNAINPSARTGSIVVLNN